MTKDNGLFNARAIHDISDQRERWQQECYGSAEKGETVFKTLSGLEVKPLYTPQDNAGIDYCRDLGFPGEAPFVRGVYPTMYRGRTWTRRQLAGFGPPEETNRRLRFLLEQGATGINTVFDYPTLRGYDSTEPQARADAGRGGVAIDTLEDMRVLFDGIPIDRISCSLVTSHPIGNISLQAMFFVAARERGIALERLSGTNQNDFLMETVICIAPEVLPPEASFKLCCDAIEYCARHAPRWNPVSFAGYNYREAGCDAVQEVSFVLANAMACLEEMLRRGWEVDDFAPRLSFFFSSHNDFFEEIAKYRAARRLWARLVKDRYGAKNPRSMALRFHVQTSGVSLTAQQPLNNVTRASYQALAAVLGGAQSVHVDAYDEALCTPTELSALTALRTQQILQLETGVTRVIDPLGGSYFLESLTHEMERRISDLVAEIDRMGGIVRAVETGWLHRQIADTAYAYQSQMESGALPVVGVNCYTGDTDIPTPLFEVPETVEIQGQKLDRILRSRDARQVESALDEIRGACKSGENLMEVMMSVVQVPLTLGEISNCLRAYYGRWNPPLF